MKIQISFILVLTLLMFLSGCKKTEKNPTEKMLDTYNDIYTYTQKDATENPTFNYVNYLGEAHYLDEDYNMFYSKTNIQINLEEMSYYASETNYSCHDEIEKEMYSTKHYGYIENEVFYYYYEGNLLGNSKITFKASKDETFTYKVFGEEITFNPYNDFLEVITSVASKEKQVLNIANLHKALHTENYIETYNITGTYPSKNEFRLDYHYAENPDAGIYNDAVEHYVLFKDNYVSKYYFKNFLGDYYLNSYSYNKEDVSRPEIDITSFEVVEPRIINLPLINMMIGY